MGLAMKQIVSEEMLKEAMGNDYDLEMHPPLLEAPLKHPLWVPIANALQDVYDPEIPVNIYELGLIYKVDIKDDNETDVVMTLTAPNCPVAGEMPGMVERAVLSVDGIEKVNVELTFDPPWEPGAMAETAKLQLNMF